MLSYYLFDEENHSLYPHELDYPVGKWFLHGLSYSPTKEDFGEMWGEAMMYDSSITFAASGKRSVIHGYMQYTVEFKMQQMLLMLVYDI